MIGTFLINCWAALFAFTLYFLFTFQNGIPSKVLIGSFIVAAITFILMYPFRLLLGYILYTPEEDLYEQFKENNESIEDLTNFSESNSSNSTTEFSDESPEEIANVVRTMINQDDTISTN